jgi:transketolase
MDVRDAFFLEVYTAIKKDKKIILLAVDQGALAINAIKRDFPKNYLNIGIFEQTAVNFAVGLAHQGYKPYIYLISPFTLRCLEQIKIGLCSMKSKVSIIASGPGFTYASDGPTHYFNEDYGILKNFPNLNFFATSDHISAKRVFRKSYKSKNPSFIRLEKGAHNKLGGLNRESINHVIKGRNILIISNGYLSVLINKIVTENSKFEDIGLLDITQIIPFDELKIKKISKKYNTIILVDESSLISSINKDIHYILMKDKKFNNKKIILLNTDFKYWKIAGDRNFLHKQNKIGEDYIKKKLATLI